MKAENINLTLDHLKSKVEEVERMQKLLEELEKSDATHELVVTDFEDSTEIHMRINMHEVTEEMAELSRLGKIGKDDIIYDPEEKLYKLTKKYRPNL